MIPLYDLIAVDEAAVLDLHSKVSEKNPELARVDVEDALTALWEDAFRAGKFKESELVWTRRPFERSPQNLAYLKRLSAGMVGMLIDAVTPDGHFKVPEGKTKRFIQVLTGIAWVWMIERSDLATRRLGQRRIIRELFQGYVRDIPTFPRQKELQEIRDDACDRRDEHLG